MKFFDLVNFGKRSIQTVHIYGSVLTLSGSSGTGTIAIGDANKVYGKLASFSSDLTTTLQNFCSVNYDYYKNLGYLISSATAVLTVTPRYGFDSVNRVKVTFTNVSGNLAGTLVGHLKIDFAKARTYRVAFGQNTTIDEPVGMKDGDTIRLELTASGAYSITWNSHFQFAGGTEHTQTSTSLDILEGFYNATADKVYITAEKKDVKA